MPLLSAMSRAVWLLLWLCAANVSLADGWVMPVDGITPNDLVDSFHDARSGGRRRHQAIDIYTERGTPVRAVVDGTVTALRTTPNGGHCFYLLGSAGYTFYYAHLDRWAAGLSNGQSVRRGEILGYVGNSGNASDMGCHLHFEVAKHGRNRNPYVLLRDRVR